MTTSTIPKFIRVLKLLKRNFKLYFSKFVIYIFAKAIVDIRLRPDAAPWPATSNIRPICVAFAWPIMGKHDVIHKTGST